MAHNVLFTNFGFSTLNAGITNVATSLAIQAGHGLRFPNPSGSQQFYCVLEDAAGNLEIIKVTTRATDNFSIIVRAQEGTFARAWVSGDKIRGALTVQGLLEFVEDPHISVATLLELISAPPTPSSGQAAEYAQARGTGTGKYLKVDDGGIENLSWGVTNFADADQVLNETVERWATFVPSVPRNATLPTTNIKDGRPVGIINKGPSTLAVKSSDATIILTLPSGYAADFIAQQDDPTAPAHWYAFGNSLESATLNTPTLLVPVIADFTSATHDHANAAGGGNVLLIPTIADFTNATHDHSDAASGGEIENAPPIGGIIGVLGTFTATGNGGVYSETGVLIGAAWKLCNGTVISDADSPFNGRFVPQLDDGRFLRGNTVGGTVGGSQTQNPFSAFAAAGNYTPAGTIPNHVHTSANHSHVLSSSGGAQILLQSSGIGRIKITGLGPNFSYGDQTGGSAFTGTGSTPSTPLIGNTNSTTPGNTGNPTTLPGIAGTPVARNTFFLNAAVNVEPRYLNCKYYQRIK